MWILNLAPMENYILCIRKSDYFTNYMCYMYANASIFCRLYTTNFVMSTIFWFLFFDYLSASRQNFFSSLSTSQLSFTLFRRSLLWQVHYSLLFLLLILLIFTCRHAQLLDWNRLWHITDKHIRTNQRCSMACHWLQYKKKPAGQVVKNTKNISISLLV